MNAIHQNQVKTCVHCGQDKPLSDFLRRSGRGVGTGARRGACRACRIVRRAMLETSAASLAGISDKPFATECAPAIAGNAPAADGQALKPARKRKRRSGKRPGAVPAGAAEAAFAPEEQEAAGQASLPATGGAELPSEPQSRNAAEAAEATQPKRKRTRRRKNAGAPAERQPSPAPAEPEARSAQPDTEPDDDARTASAAQHGSVTPVDGPESDRNGQTGQPERAPSKRKRPRRRKSKAAKAAALAAMEAAAAAQTAAVAVHAESAPQRQDPAERQPLPAASAAGAAAEPPYESKSARRRRLKMLSNGYGTPVFIIPANFLPLPPEQFEDEEDLEPAAEAAAGAEEPAPRPKRKRKRSRRRKPKTAAEPLAEAAPRVVTRRPPPLPPPGSVASDGSELRPTRQGVIRMRGRTDKGRRWQQETDLETALALVREHAAVVVNPFTIRRLFTSKAFRMYILDRDQYTCYFCGQYGDTIDHLRPRAKGGHTTPLNCVCACSLCNQSKADRDLDEFVGE